MDYAGAGMINKRILVCSGCEDRPQAQLRSLILPADPVPIQNPRVPNWAAMETDYRTTVGPTTTDPRTGLQMRSGDQRTTLNSDKRIVEQNGNDMLAPPFETRERVADAKSDTRITQDNAKRLTQLRLKVPPPPYDPIPFVDYWRVTQDGLFRATMVGDIRATAAVVFSDLRATESGDVRQTLDGNIRLTYPFEFYETKVFVTMSGDERVTQLQDVRLSEPTPWQNTIKRKFTRK